MAQPDLSEDARRTFRIVYEVKEAPERWLLDEDDVPETPDHDLTLTLLRALLVAWVERRGLNARVARNLACRWDPKDARVGVDPDLALIEPDSPSIAEVGQLRLWLPDHVPPRLAFEVVSQSTASKDYADLPARYARLGCREVWVFDPQLFGPEGELGPHVLSGWRQEDDAMVRVHAGEGPGWSEELGAWLIPTGDDRLRIADDPAGQSLWLTAEEAARWEAGEQRRLAEEQQRRADEQQRRAEAAEEELRKLKLELKGH